MLSYLKQTIGSIAERDFAHIGQDKTVADAAKVMRDKDTTSILITKKDSSEPVGIVTERDILYRVLAQNKDPSATLLNDIMNYPLMYADEDSSIKDGICLMRNKNLRRLPIHIFFYAGGNKTSSLMKSLENHLDEATVSLKNNDYSSLQENLKNVDEGLSTLRNDLSSAVSYLMQ